MISGAAREFRYPASFKTVQYLKIGAGAAASSVLFGIAVLTPPVDYTNRVSVFGFAIVFLLGALAVWRNLSKTKKAVRVSEDGITQVLSGSVQLHVPWSDIAAFRNHWFPRGLSIETPG